MRRKKWIPVTGELVLRTLDDNSGMKIDDLMRELGLNDSYSGYMALICTLVDLAEANLVGIDGIDGDYLTRKMRQDMSFFFCDERYVWRTTAQWMRTRRAITEVRIGSTRPDKAEPLLCYPVFGRPGSHLDQTDIFVVMPFAKELQPIYEDHLTKVARELTLSIARSDDFYTNTALMMDIWSAIYSSSLVIADCTGRNPNVFYELGIAHTIGVPVIMISQSGSDIPADLRHLRYYVYEFTPRGMAQLEVTIRNVIDTTMFSLH